MPQAPPHTADEILSILDACCDGFTFPMLDNGYVYLAATRLALFRSPADWALTIEVFGFSPRSGLPDTHVHTFSSSIYHRKPASEFVSAEAHENYLRGNPHNESRFIFPIDQGSWMDDEEGELVATTAETIPIRGEPVPLPGRQVYAELGIELSEAPRIAVFELCRALAASHRSALLATDDELRVNVRPDMTEILRLDEWHHPNVVDDGDRPSGSQTFQQLAQALVSGDASHYQPTLEANTHWKHWPEGGTL